MLVDIWPTSKYKILLDNAYLNPKTGWEKCLQLIQSTFNLFQLSSHISHKHREDLLWVRSLNKSNLTLLCVFLVHESFSWWYLVCSLISSSYLMCWGFFQARELFFFAKWLVLTYKTSMGVPKVWILSSPLKVIPYSESWHELFLFLGIKLPMFY